MPFDSHSTTLDRISALYAEQSALRACSWRRETEQRRLAAIALELAAAWQQRRREILLERLMREAGMRCRDCGEPLTPWTIARIGRRATRLCVPCHRARISAGRRRQLATDRTFVERVLRERAIGG